MMDLDIVVVDPVTGRDSGLSKTIRRGIKTLKSASLQFCVVDAIALAVRGFPRMTREFKIAILAIDAKHAISAFRKGGFRSITPADESDDSDPMVVFEDPVTRMEVDLLIAAGNPEALIISTAPRARVF